MNTCLLDALAGKNRGRPPIWLMRQAGRYMTSYKKLRQQHTFEQLALTPELAAKVTLLPIQEFDLDAAILFSDILFPLSIFGVNIEFPDASSPKISRQTPFQFPSDIEGYLKERLSPVYEAIRLLKSELDRPLIGFAGAPWTLFSYLVGTENAGNEYPGFEKLFSYLEELVTTHLLLQIQAGCDVVQIFDSLAHLIPYESVERLSLSPLARITQKLSCPCIFYKAQKATVGFFNKPIECALSLDGSLEIANAREKLSHPYTLQGNIDPLLLAGDKEPLEAATKQLLNSMRHDPGFIVNVSSGLLPQTKEENVKLLVQMVKQA